MQARSAAAAKSQWDLQKRTYERELSFSAAEAASRVVRTSTVSSSSSSVGSQVAGIQNVLAEYGVTSIADSDILLLLKTNLTSYDRMVDPSRISGAFRCIEAYALNLYHRPWKKEYYRLKMYCGFYKTYVDAYLKNVDVVFYKMGYTLNDDNSEWRMVGMNSPEWAGEVARSCLNIAFHCRVAAVECDCVAIACAQLSDLDYSPTRVFFHRLEHPALPRDTALQLRTQAHESSKTVAAAATTPIGSSRLQPAGSDSLGIATGISRAKPSATAQAAAVAISASAGRSVQLELGKELSDPLVGGTGIISVNSRVIRLPPPQTAASGLNAPASGTHRPAASANSVLPTFRQPVEMAEPSRSSYDDVDTYRGGTGAPWHVDRTRSATTVSPSANAGIVDRDRLLLFPASSATSEHWPLSSAVAASSGLWSTSSPMLLPPVAAGFARIGSMGLAAAGANVPRVADAWPSSQHNRAGSGSSAANASTIDDARLLVNRLSWEPEEATADEHMAMSLQLLEEPAPHLPPPPAFSGGHEVSHIGMIPRDESGYTQWPGPGSELRGFNYREPPDRPVRPASATSQGSQGSSPGAGSSSAGADGTDFSLMQFSIREPPVGASVTEWPGMGLDRTLRTAYMPQAAGVGGAGRGSGLQSKQSASHPQYGPSAALNSTSFPQYPVWSGSEEASGPRKQFSIYSRIDQ